MMKIETLIVGAGLSGLSATYWLQAAKQDVLLIEASERVGGRVLTVGETETGKRCSCDLGPSWVWPDQPLAADALNQFGLSTYPQFAQGKVIHQPASGTVTAIEQTSPMAGSLRIAGGVEQLAKSYADGIESKNFLSSHILESAGCDGGPIKVCCRSPAGTIEIEANRLAVAMPPRLVRKIDWSPRLPEKTEQTLEATPTWMAGHAKFFAVYEKAFWRQNGLCGTALSQLGPLTEIHDASPESEEVGVLFGFLGIDAQTRAQWGRDRIVESAVNQLVQIFGTEAAPPVETHFKDWSRESFTAVESDRTPQTRHPTYGMKIDVGDAWRGKLFLMGSETSAHGGGLIEGALNGGYQFAMHVLGKDSGRINESSHSASMGWDWLT